VVLKLTEPIIDSAHLYFPLRGKIRKAYFCPPTELVLCDEHQGSNSAKAIWFCTLEVQIKGGWLKDLHGFFSLSYAPHWLMLQDLFFLSFSFFRTSWFVSKLTTAAKTVGCAFIMKINSAPAAIVHSPIIEAAIIASHSNSLTQVSTNQSPSP